MFQSKYEQDEDGGDENVEHIMFSKADKDNDNEISSEELAKYLDSIKEDTTEEDVKVCFLINTSKK